MWWTWSCCSAETYAGHKASKTKLVQGTNLLPFRVCPCSGTVTNCRDLTLLRDVRQNYLAGLKSDLVPWDLWSLLIAALSPFSLTGESGSGGWERGDEVWSWCFFLLWGDGPHSITRYVLLSSASGTVWAPAQACLAVSVELMALSPPCQHSLPQCPWGTGRWQRWHWLQNPAVGSGLPAPRGCECWL